MTTALYIIVAILAGGVVYFNTSGELENDSPFEEFIEEVIKEVFDVSIDLSPGDEDGDKDKDL